MYSFLEGTPFLKNNTAEVGFFPNKLELSKHSMCLGKTLILINFLNF